MRAVMLSVRPEWCDLILHGQKTIELRKSRPVMMGESRFKVYIYCTSGENIWLTSMPGHKYMQINERIVGTFVCDKITRLTHIGKNKELCVVGNNFQYEPPDELLRAACLSRATAEEYLKNRDGFGWHISNLKIFSPPVKMKDFWGLKPCPHSEDCFDYDCYGAVDCDVPRSICRPPQDWRYVEEKR